jgi:hypothetical protein
MTHYANVQELEDQLRQVTVEYDDLDFEQRLNYANQRVQKLVGNQTIEYKTIEFEEETVVDLEATQLISFDKVVEAFDNNVVDASNYTVDNSKAQIDFTQSFVDDNFFDGYKLKLYYTPEIFKQLEIWIAMRNILETELIHTSDEVTNTQVERLNTRVQSVVDNINSGNPVTVQRGDNANRGSQAPRFYGGD